jgi:hypothetical protein
LTRGYREARAGVSIVQICPTLWIQPHEQVVRAYKHVREAISVDIAG